MASNILNAVYEAGRDFAAKTGAVGKTIAALTGLDSTQLASVLESLSQPSLCFIPIQSESITMRRTADIGTTMLISQTDQRKEYITDNTAPRPRTWTGRGYITALAPLVENYLVIKPTLQAQQSILEAAVESRQPVKFKTDSGEVTDVLIQDLQISSTPKGMNARAVSYTVQEVTVLENSILTGATEVLDSVGINSIPVNAMISLGKNTALGAGIVNTVSSLLSIRL